MKCKFFSAAAALFILLGLAGCNSETVTEPKSHAQLPPQPAPAHPTTPSAQDPATTPSAQDPATTPDQPVSENPVNSYSWYFTRNNQHQVPYVDQSIRNLLAQNNAFYVLPNNQSKIYLTFDAGYEMGYTAQILDILKANGVKAAFFITGQYLNSQPDLVKRMKNEGNLVCNHTFNHPDCARISSEKLQKEIISLEEQFLSVTGQPMDHYLRPPMGNYSPASLETTSKLGYKTVFWSMAFNDWNPAEQPGADYSYNHVTANIHPGAVILLHAVSQSDTEALDRIIKDLKSQGYVFTTFD
jgi:peptidoglycan-N-acetylmuramic acid deacetylase